MIDSAYVRSFMESSITDRQIPAFTAAIRITRLKDSICLGEFETSKMMVGIGEFYLVQGDGGSPATLSAGVTLTIFQNRQSAPQRTILANRLVTPLTGRVQGSRSLGAKGGPVQQGREHRAKCLPNVGEAIFDLWRNLRMHLTPEDRVFRALEVAESASYERRRE